jgi:hypothetical protein
MHRLFPWDNFKERNTLQEIDLDGKILSRF